MSEFIEELNKKKILSRDDIQNLKEYIYKKNPQKTSSEKANILSHAIHCILDNNLQGLGSNSKNEIKKVVLKNLLILNEEKVLLSDIFEIYCSLCLENDFSHSEIINWLNLHIDQEVSLEDLSTYTQKNNTNSKEFVHKTGNKEIITEDDFNYNAVNINAETLISSEMHPNIIADVETSNILGLIKRKYFIPFLILIILVFSFSLFKIFSTKTIAEKSYIDIIIKKDINDTSLNKTDQIIKAAKNTSKLSKEYRYIEINSPELKKFLNSKNSLLAEEPYFSTIILAAKEYDLNPLILFAITGQEQGFVPKDNKDAKKIANNPFNVYHSWKEYNTSIEDTCKIASITIINICKDLPSDIDTFEWINKTYAEDKEWGKGVKIIFEKLCSINNNSCN